MGRRRRPPAGPGPGLSVINVVQNGGERDERFRSMMARAGWLLTGCCRYVCTNAIRDC
jgi:hypothetical protein